MAIYGTALLSLCLLAGIVVGKLLGLAIGINANVGGVGFAMLLLILASGRLQSQGKLPTPSRSGVLFWSSLYIPIVVAMAASHNVRAAVNGSAVALVAGGTVVVTGFALVALIGRLSPSDDDANSLTASGSEREAT